jgi:hypothetical protein
MEIMKPYAEEDPTHDSDDELGGRRNRRNIRGDGQCDYYRFL